LLTKRLRIFAGPNGSGKSAIEKRVSSKYNIGTFINADKIEQLLRTRGQLSFNTYGIQVSRSALSAFIKSSGFQEKVDLTRISSQLSLSKNILSVKSKIVPCAYLGAILSEFLRNKCLDQNRTFSFETVMSHPGKLDFIKAAKSNGFKTYLYFVCTESFKINIDRVKSRVQLGGHSVPINKIRSRYSKSLDLLADAVQLADRALSMTTRETIQFYWLKRTRTNLRSLCPKFHCGLINISFENYHSPSQKKDIRHRNEKRYN
jgi:predicted ABC-type ATPase